MQPTIFYNYKQPYVGLTLCNVHNCFKHTSEYSYCDFAKLSKMQCVSEKRNPDSSAKFFDMIDWFLQIIHLI